ncbi:sensor histidine kinase [Petrocella sp. FN5]|uniref:sensor histidine kinase n=1 Tax=Petrocella sp. FN5 TaxID=3032002 RepID=UPI0023DB5B1E|nr:histidine kinase N-terminal 7TM domain-containing protein [Petrocella sp. FN5]MDF1616869.1 histidine kinase N-terminal 7TM domain-containing protein [Petrocella sp. FN5]
MEVSEKLAIEILTIFSFHIVSLMLLLGFSFYIYLKAKKTPLLYSYLIVVMMLLIWIVSKLFKTIAPTQDLRWFFIVTQYVGVCFLGYFMLVFAYIYQKNTVPSKRLLFFLALFPLLAFVTVLTNPLHMGFYSYFDFYRDRFGPFFYPIQIFQYLYIFIAIIYLSKNYTRQPGFFGRRIWGRFFALITLLPLFTNFYYILFKLDLMTWIFPFPVFDFTPISGSIAIVLFMIPALRFRFFDHSPISYYHIYSGLPQGIVFIHSSKEYMYGANPAFIQMFPDYTDANSLNTFYKNCIFQKKDKHKHLHAFLTDQKSMIPYSLELEPSIVYEVSKKNIGKKQFLICFKDISNLVSKQNALSNQKHQLTLTNHKLDTLAQKTKELAIAKAKSKIAQNMHDILGHSLTVVIGTAELAATDQHLEASHQKLMQISELLTNGLNDLKNTFINGESSWGTTSLTHAIHCLKNQKIQLDFLVQGQVYELDSPQTEAVFRLCQEAMTNAIKHGQAKNLHIVLRFEPAFIHLFIIDDGNGCTSIIKNYGLKGIEERFSSLGGHVNFGSDGVHGFNIHATLPKFYTDSMIIQSDF